MQSEAAVNSTFTRFGASSEVGMRKGIYVRPRAVLLALYCSVLCCTGSVSAQDQDAEAPDGQAQGDAAVSAEAQATNPLGDFRALNIHNYYIPELSGPTDETANTMILR